MKFMQPPHNDKPREACAVFGVSLSTGEEAAGIVFNSLLALQHRGQEGAGIAVAVDNNIFCHKNAGLVSEVFSEKELGALPGGRIAIGHTLYSTAGANEKENAGPFVTEYLTGRIAVSLNGLITNAAELRADLTRNGLYFNTCSDGETVSSLIAYCITKERDMFSGAVTAANLMTGAYSFAIAGGDRLIAVRDPWGFRPMCIGQNEDGFAIASESCALDSCGFEFVRDIKPGEAVEFINGALVAEGVRLSDKGCNGGSRQCSADGGLEGGYVHNEDGAHGLCVFEYVYFARPDSVIDGLSVYQARYNMGLELAEEYPADADIVCGAPDTGLDAASGYSAGSGLPLVPGFVRNRYIGRSFIYPTQMKRESAVRLKLNPLSFNIAGKRVVFVDDSIVRGTTTEKTVRSLKTAGAREVHVRISSPPFYNMCRYGTDIDSEENLIANKMGLDGIRRKIGADSLGYISVGGLKKACSKCAMPFCTECFTRTRGE